MLVEMKREDQLWRIGVRKRKQRVSSLTRAILITMITNPPPGFRIEPQSPQFRTDIGKKRAFLEAHAKRS